MESESKNPVIFKHLCKSICYLIDEVNKLFRLTDINSRVVFQHITRRGSQILGFEIFLDILQN